VGGRGGGIPFILLILLSILIIRTRPPACADRASRLKGDETQLDSRGGRVGCGGRGGGMPLILRIVPSIIIRRTRPPECADCASRLKADEHRLDSGGGGAI